MAIVELSNGGVYNFITQGGSTNHIASFGGTDYPFQTYFIQGIVTSGSSTSTINNLIANNTLTYRGLQRYKDPTKAIGSADAGVVVNTVATVTSSLTSAAILEASGGIYIFRNNANHHVNLCSAGTAGHGTIIRFIKSDSNTNTIKLQPTGSINDSGSLSCSDPFCTIELMSIQGGSAKWIILSKNGAWS